MILELALTCAPQDLCLVAAVPPGEVPTWSWLKWLPHTAATTTGLHGRPGDRLVATDADELQKVLEAVVAPRLRLLEERTWATSQQVFARAVVVVDRFDPLTEIGFSGALTQALARAREVGVTVIALCDSEAVAPTESTALLTVEPGAAVLRRLGTPSAPRAFAPVALAASHAERVARRLAPKRLVADSLRAGAAGSSRLADLLDAAPSGAGLLAAAQAPKPASLRTASGSSWPEQEPSALLRVPFAVTADGSPLLLDLKESADGGHGPHGP